MTKLRLIFTAVIILSVLLTSCGPANVTENDVASSQTEGTASLQDAETVFAMPKPSSENLAEVVFWTCAAPSSAKSFTGNDAKTLLEAVNKHDFILTKFTQEDITNDQGNYYKLTFKYKDGTKYDFSYDGYYHTSAAEGIFEIKENDKPYCPIAYSMFFRDYKIYSFKKPSDPIQYINFPKISTENISSCVAKLGSTKYTFSEANMRKLINYINTCKFYQSHHGISTHMPLNYSPYKITITYNDSTVVELKNDCCITINTKEGFYFQKETGGHPIKDYLFLFCDPQQQ